VRRPLDAGRPGCPSRGLAGSHFLATPNVATGVGGRRRPLRCSAVWSCFAPIFRGSENASPPKDGSPDRGHRAFGHKGRTQSTSVPQTTLAAKLRITLDAYFRATTASCAVRNRVMMPSSVAYKSEIRQGSPEPGEWGRVSGRPSDGGVPSLGWCRPFWLAGPRRPHGEDWAGRILLQAPSASRARSPPVQWACQGDSKKKLSAPRLQLRCQPRLPTSTATRWRAPRRPSCNFFDAQRPRANTGCRPPCGGTSSARIPIPRRTRFNALYPPRTGPYRAKCEAQPCVVFPGRSVRLGSPAGAGALSLQGLMSERSPGVGCQVLEAGCR